MKDSIFKYSQFFSMLRDIYQIVLQFQMLRLSRNIFYLAFKRILWSKNSFYDIAYTTLTSRIVFHYVVQSSYHINVKHNVPIPFIIKSYFSFLLTFCAFLCHSHMNACIGIKMNSCGYTETYLYVFLYPYRIL